MLKPKKTSITLTVLTLLFCLIAVGTVSAADTPTANFTSNVTNGTGPLSVQFTDTSTNSPTSWSWDFGDNETSTEQNPTHTYNNEGTYNVSLTVANEIGNNTITQNNYINVVIAPTANFTADTRNTVTWGANNVTVQFNDTSTYNPTSWLWDFGDGTNSTEQNPTHTYNIGNYTVSLTVTNAAGSSTQTKIDYIIINEEPITLTNNRHIFIYVANIDGVRYDLDGALYGGPNGTYYIKADGGGLNALTIDQLTTSTNSTGSFIIVEGGGSGGSGEIILLISVEGPISDDFSVNIISSGYDSTSGTYSVLTLNETFTKEDLLYGPTLYKPGPGTLGTWSLLLYNNEDTSDNSTASYLMFIDLYANGRAQVNFTFSNMTTVAAFNVYTWRSGGNQGEGISWTNNPETSGYVVIGKAPVADFTVNSTIGTSPLTVQFTDTSTYNPTSWLWDFGDGTNSTEQNPTHTYNTTGTYTVTLTAANNNGNNTTTQTDLIKVGTPELVTSNLEIPTNTTTGTTYTINTTVTNTGITDAGTFVVKLYDNNVQVGKIVVNELTAGASTILNFNWTPTTTGNHILSVIADVNKQINETNRTNSQITQNVNVIASTLPELVVSDLQIPIDPVNGTTYTINVTVTNTGNSDTGEFVVKLYDNNVQVGKIVVNELTAGASTILNFNWTPTTTGNHILSVIADANKQINETNRNNNQITQTVNTTASTLPDLITTNLELPIDPVVGTTYTINVTITNTGPTDITSNFAVKLYDNNTQIQKITVNSLAAGESTVLTFNWTPTTNGTHNLSVIADANKQLTETIETNNQITESVTAT
jgi:large repetitive protein